MTEFSLHGIELLVPPRGEGDWEDALARISPEFATMQRLQAETIATARAMGALIIENASADSDLHARQLAQPRSFTLIGMQPHFEQVQAELAARSDVLAGPWRAPFADYQARDDKSFPVFMASSKDGGVAKYLVEEQGQLDKLQALCAAFPAYQLDRLFEARQYIATPSDRFTSYRVLATATGEIIGAALLYSAHRKSEQARIVGRHDKHWDVVGKSLLSTLENPATPYFLNALDARSNVAQGGGCIPLMGNGASRPPSEVERAILAAHGIDADQVRLPAELHERASVIGKVLGKNAGIVVGVDFLQEAGTSRFHFLEINPEPGPQTYAACWLEDSVPSQEAYRAMFQRSLASLALAK